jgi:hypothetical protein
LATVQELIGQIKKGELLLPEFQRGYVWSRNQVRAFVRSLYRGHPTGHLLIWKTYKPPKTRGDAKIGDSYSLLLLDGQQRLTTLYTLFEGKPPPFHEGDSLFFDLYFNLQTEELRFWQKVLMAADPNWLSVHGLLSWGLAKFLQNLPTLDPSVRSVYEAHLGRIGRLDNIRQYLYQVDQVSDDVEIEEVVEIFNLVNSAGTTLTKADLALAYVCSIWPEARQEMRQFSKDMAAHGFGVDLTFLLRCVAALSSGSILLEGSFYQLPADDLQLSWKKVKTAFEHLVNVLKHDAFIDDVHDLPTANVLIPITVYLARNGSSFSDDPIKRKFIRWMFLAALWERYSGSTETKLQKDITTVDSTDPVDELVDAILDQRGRVRVEAKDLAGKGTYTSAYKMSYVLARARGAKDWSSGVTLYSKAVGRSNGLESHHIFPKAVLAKAGFAGNDHKRIVNEVANRAFLTKKANTNIAAKPPIDYFPIVEASFPGALAAQSVPLDPALWGVDHYEDFLKARQNLLAEALNEFLEGLIAQQGSPAAKPLDDLPALMAGGESAFLEFKASLRCDITTGVVNKALERAVVKSVAGFLNSKKGGALMIGVANTAVPIGLDHDYTSLSKPDWQGRDLFENHLTQLIAQMLGAAVMMYVTVSFHDLEGKDVCLVRVEPSNQPVYLDDEGKLTFFLRAGNATLPLPTPEVVKYVASRWP